MARVGLSVGMTDYGETAVIQYVWPDQHFVVTHIYPSDGALDVARKLGYVKEYIEQNDHKHQSLVPERAPHMEPPLK